MRVVKGADCELIVSCTIEFRRVFFKKTGDPLKRIKLTEGTKVLLNVLYTIQYRITNEKEMC